MQYQFKALKDNKIIFRKIDADNESAVINYLRSNNYLPVEIKKVEESSLHFLDSFFNRVSFNDVVDFTRQIAIMLNAGLTIVEALDILKKQIKNTKLLKLIEDIDNEIKSGNTFSNALKKYPQNFSNLYISLVKSGELSGKLSDILLKLSDNLEKEREFKGKLKGALAYPVIVVIAMIGVIFIMLTFVVPQLMGMYKDFNVELPMTTKILMDLSSFCSKFWPLIIGTTILTFILLKRYFSSKSGKLKLDSFFLKLPVIGEVIKVSSLVDATRTLAILFSSGVSILDSLNIVVETTGNIRYQDSFKNIYKQVEKGQTLGNSLEREGIFPPILVQMTIVGEQTGHLDDTLLRLSRYFEMESELAIKAMTTLIEPTILVFLGLGVGGLVMAVITPIYNLTASFK